MSIWGLSVSTFTEFHVVLSLIGIVAGLFVVFGLLRRRSFELWTAIFLATTVATSITGFGFPFEKLGPPHIVGIVSLIALAIAIVARYAKQLAGRWRAVYAIAAVVSLYLNVFVGVVQAFQKVDALHALAPTQTEAPFAIAQGAVFLLFAALGFFATTRFKPATAPLRTTSPVP